MMIKQSGRLAPSRSGPARWAPQRQVSGRDGRVGAGTRRERLPAHVLDGELSQGQPVRVLLVVEDDGRPQHALAQRALSKPVPVLFLSRYPSASAVRVLLSLVSHRTYRSAAIRRQSGHGTGSPRL